MLGLEYADNDLNRRVFDVVWNTLLLSVVADVTVNLAIEATPAL